jgi:hypothetical protein
MAEMNKKAEMAEMNKKAEMAEMNKKAEMNKNDENEIIIEYNSWNY